MPTALLPPDASVVSAGDRLAHVDVLIDGVSIAEVAPRLPGQFVPARDGVAEVETGGRVAWPACVDLHTHLDNAFTWKRAPNPTGTWQDALIAVERDRERYWTEEDIAGRMDYALRCTWTHGTRAVRTHLDSLEGQRELSWRAFGKVRDRWKGRIALQGVSLVLPFRYAGAGGVELADLVARHDGLLGGVLIDDPDPQPAVDRIFSLAHERDLDIDLHVDETLDPRSNSLDAVARATLRHGYEGRVTVGHCCSLSARSAEEAASSIAALREAGVAVVSLPLCNLYLQDRVQGVTPRRRGVTLVQELAAAGIPVAFASDDVRDAYYPFGDCDAVEIYAQAVRIAQLERDAADWVAAVTSTPAALMRLPGSGRVQPGAPADLILFEARDLWELLSTPGQPRSVIRAGREVMDPHPDPAELDGLLGGGPA